VLLVALAAVNRPGSVRLEWDLSLLSALRTGYVCHLSWGAIKAASTIATAAAFIFSLEHLIHVPLYRFKESNLLQKSSQQNQLNRRNAAFL
jgi:hypothetical protein